MKISLRLRGGNRLAGGSLLTVTAILVRIQAEREGGDYVLVCFIISIQCTFLPGCAGTPACQRISTHGYGDFGSQRKGRVEILFCCVLAFLYHEHFSRAVRGKPACRRLFSCGCGKFDSYTSGTGGWGFRFSVFQQLNSQRLGLPSCAGGTGLPSALYARFR